jgi:hypothetical protein
MKFNKINNTQILYNISTFILIVECQNKQASGHILLNMTEIRAIYNHQTQVHQINVKQLKISNISTY